MLGTRGCQSTATVKSKDCLFCRTHPQYQPNVPLIRTQLALNRDVDVAAEVIHGLTQTVTSKGIMTKKSKVTSMSIMTRLVLVSD